MRAARADGWHELTVAAVRTGGTRYAFRIDGRRRRCRIPPRAATRGTCTARARWSIRAPSSGTTTAWRGRPWDEAVIYELHVGTFTPRGHLPRARSSKLDHLAELGVTAIELMPVADFPGRRNWGYDGVLPFAPDARLRHARRT